MRAVGNRIVTEDFRYNTSLGLAPLTGDPGLYFSGPNAMAAYGGRVPLYSPNFWEQGSSGSHTDDGTFTGKDAVLPPRLLMNSKLPLGLGVRELGAVELGMLADLGYAVVPEPGVWAGLTGLGLVLYASWRRR